MSLAQALEAGDLAELPGRRDEDWRWTDLRGLMREPVERSPKLERPLLPGGPFARLGAIEVVFANGQLNCWPERASKINFMVFTHHKPQPPRSAGALPMVRLAAERGADPPVTILEFGPGEPRTALVRQVAMTVGSGHHSRIGVMVKAGAKATLLESYEGRSQGYFSNTVVEIYIEAGASLERVVLADDAPSAVSVTTAEVHLARGARFAQTVLTTGAKRQRNETHLNHPGQDVSVRLDGIYLIGGNRHADLTSVVTHGGRDGSTTQLAKGAVSGAGRAVFQGRIVVKPGADGTDARMGHHALILSDRGEVDARPELLIHADDVACAHGNTVGAIDEDALFYARARGIPEAEARAMLTEAFVGEVVDRMEHEGAREVARAWVGEKLRGLG